MLQMVRLGNQYINLEHVLGVAFGLHVWEDDEGPHSVTLAIVEMAQSMTAGGASGYEVLVTHRFYGQTALTLRAWLDERTTVIAEEAEECPEQVWHCGQDEDEDDLNAEADVATAERASDIRAGAPAWIYEGPECPF